MVLWYFAYGRNINIDELIRRIERYPLIICRGILPGYDLRFNKDPGPKSGTGYANMVPAEGRWVEGLLYLLNEEDMDKLDKFEGVPQHYKRHKVNVWNIEKMRWVIAETYVAVRTRELKPPKEYLIEIIKAAEEALLSPEWIEYLNKFLDNAI